MKIYNAVACRIRHKQAMVCFAFAKRAGLALVLYLYMQCQTTLKRKRVLSKDMRQEYLVLKILLNVTLDV